MLKEKKSQGLPLNTIVIAILVVIVLLVIIVFFTTRVGESGETLESSSSASNMCSIACTTTGYSSGTLTSSDTCSGKFAPVGSSGNGRCCCSGGGSTSGGNGNSGGSTVSSGNRVEGKNYATGPGPSGFQGENDE